MCKNILFKRYFSIAILVMALGWPSDGFSMPMFARKYRTSCTTCHAPFPKLNAVGEAFRLNGYKMPGGDEAYVKDEPVSMGADAYKRVWPKAIWPSDMPGMPPISIRVLSDMLIDAGGNRVATDFNFPHETELFGAGSLGDRMSFFVELEEEDGGITSEGWFQFEDIFANFLGENHFNVKVGVLGQQELFLPNARDTHDRFSKAHYLYASYRLPGSANRFRLRSSQPGIEINSFDTRWKAAIGVVNGNAGNADNNSEKDVYGQVAFKIGGVGFDGSSGAGEESMGGDPAGYWRDDSIAFGLFAYRGVAPIAVGGVTVDDDFYRIGIDSRVTWRELSVAAGYIWGNNDDPFATGQEVDSAAWFAEGHYWLLPWVTPYLRLEGLDIDVPAGVADGDQTRCLFGCNFLIRANVRLLIEGLLYTDDDTVSGLENSENDSNIIQLRLDVAF